MTVQQIKYKKNPHQSSFHNDDQSRILHLSCGFGGGKTYSLVMKLLKLTFQNKNIDGGLVAPSLVDVKKDVMPCLEDICFENGIDYKHNKQDNWIQFPWSKGKVWLTSGERKIRGPNWGFAAINEVTLLQDVRYKEVLGRVRVKKAKNPQIVMSGTPEGTGHWLYKELIEKQNNVAKVIYGDTRDNAQNLDPHYIQSLYDSYDDIMIDAYLRGLWVNMAGNRFYYSYDPHKNHDNTINYIKELPILISMDFNVNPMSCAMWHKYNGNLYGFDEIKLMSANTYKLAEAIKSRGYNPNSCIIYPDPAGNSRRTSGKSDIQILKEAGFHNIRVKKKAPDMRTRQLNVNNLLDKQIITFNPDKMPGVKKDLSEVVQDQVSLGKDKRNPELTHFSDGIDYLCDIEYPFSGHKPNKSGYIYNPI